MTAKELIKQLKKLPPDTLVLCIDEDNNLDEVLDMGQMIVSVFEKYGERSYAREASYDPITYGYKGKIVAYVI